MGRPIILTTGHSMLLRPGAFLGTISLILGSACVAGLTVSGSANAEDLGPEGSGKRVVIGALTTATSSTYLEPDGTQTVEVASGRINYQEPDGTWQRIDNTLVDSPGSTFAVENSANDYVVRIPSQASETPVEFRSDGSWVTLRMHGLHDRPAVDDATAEFDVVESAESVSYVATSEGVKENIVLDKPPVVAPIYSYSLDASPGLNPVLTNSGRIEFRDEWGEAVIIIPAGIMVDSANEPAISSRVSYALRAVGRGWRLSVEPDQRWLADPARIYPVTIDPSIIGDPVIHDCFIATYNPDGQHCGFGTTYLKVGRSDSAHKYRGLLDFNVSSIPPGSTIIDAAVHMNLDSSQTLDTALPAANYALAKAGKAFDNQATWNSSGSNGTWQGGSPGSNNYGDLAMRGNVSGEKVFSGLAALVQGWIDGGLNNGLVLRQVGESTNNVLSFYGTESGNGGPTLTVNYALAPGADDESADPPPAIMTAYGVDSDELDDLTEIAAQQGITVQNAVDLYGWQNDYSLDIQKLRTSFGDSFAWSQANSSGGAGVTVHFKGAVPAGASSVMSNLQVPVNLVSDALYTESEMDAVLDSAHDAIVAASGPDAAVATSFNVRSNTLSASVDDPGATMSDADREAVAISAIENATNSSTLPNIDVKTDPDAVVATTLFGGSVIQEDANSWTCTSGFPVNVHLQNQSVGLVTADHCSNTLPFYVAQSSRNRLYDRNRSADTDDGDIQFHFTHDEEVGHSFYVNPGKRHRLAALNYPTWDDKLCVFGRVTNKKKCATVAERVDVTYRGDVDGDQHATRTYHHLWMLNDNVSKPGDSGGPVFRGGNAYGLISGIRDGRFTIISPIWPILDMNLDLHYPGS